MFAGWLSGNGSPNSILNRVTPRAGLGVRPVQSLAPADAGAAAATLRPMARQSEVPYTRFYA